MKVSARRNIENRLHRYGFVAVAGVDEVGRGCLAGPVMAGAVILHPDRRIDGLADSKACTLAQRERLHDEICKKAVAWAVVAVEPDEIDRINIHQATLQAMRRAVLTLAPLPDAVLVDAFRIPSLPMAQRGVIGGDRRSSAIAAASIMVLTDIRAPPPLNTLRRWRGLATHRCIAGRSGRPACLIPLTERPYSAAVRS